MKPAENPQVSRFGDAQVVGWPIAQLDPNCRNLRKTRRFPVSHDNVRYPTLTCGQQILVQHASTISASWTKHMPHGVAATNNWQSGLVADDLVICIIGWHGSADTSVVGTIAAPKAILNLVRLATKDDWVWLLGRATPSHLSGSLRASITCATYSAYRITSGSITVEPPASCGAVLTGPYWLVVPSSSTSSSQ